MKTTKTICLFLLMACPSVLFAQDKIDTYLEAGTGDAAKLVKSYMKPIAKSIGIGLNNGWYNTARTHKTLGFDLTITANAVVVPPGGQYFMFRNSDYGNIKLAHGTSHQMGTALGPNKEGPTLLVLDDHGNTTDKFKALPGLGLKKQIGYNAVPVPMVQLGLGMVHNTDLKLRFIPNINIQNSTEIGLWGVGIMHDIAKDISSIPFDLSVFGGYTHLFLSYDLSGYTAGNNKSTEFSASSFTIQAIISKKFSVLTLYGAAGYNSTKTRVKLTGTYYLDYGTLHDPLNIPINASSMTFSGGLMLKLFIFTINADYTFNDTYSVLTAGFGFRFR